MRSLRLVLLCGLAAAVVLVTQATTMRAEEGPGPASLYTHGGAGAVPCFGCHGLQGQGVGDFPRLAGLPARYVAEQMAAYRDGTRPNAIMEAIAKPLDAGQVRELAEYVAALDAPFPAPPEADARMLAAGARLVTLGDWSRGVPACRDCHGPALRGGGPALPGLAGQPEGYLVGQLNAFKEGTRPGGPLDLMTRIASRLEAGDLQAAASYVASLREDQETEAPRGETSDWKPHAQDPDAFSPPPESALPPGAEDAAAVLLGERIFENTPKYAPLYAGNAMSCRNCHTDRGRNPDASPMWAAVPQYPKYRSKNGKINTLAMRIEGCFRYSENGTPPPADSTEMAAMISYMHWLASGLPVGIKPKASGYAALDAPSQKPNRDRGREVYAASCAVCHGATGQGSVVAGARVIPPLWGSQSFNWGAGMHDVDKAAAFIYRNMPHGAAGSLSQQQAWDVAAWIDSQPRPQDPRFTESVEKTRDLYHKKRDYDFYGDTLDGWTLGAPGTLESWQKLHPPDAD